MEAYALKAMMSSVLHGVYTEQTCLVVKADSPKDHPEDAEENEDPQPWEASLQCILSSKRKGGIRSNGFITLQTVKEMSR